MAHFTGFLFDSGHLNTPPDLILKSRLRRSNRTGGAKGFHLLSAWSQQFVTALHESGGPAQAPGMFEFFKAYPLETQNVDFLGI